MQEFIIYCLACFLPVVFLAGMCYGQKKAYQHRNELDASAKKFRDDLSRVD